MGKGVDESSPTLVGLTEETGAMVAWSEESAGEEESVREKGGSGSGEATEGLVRLGKNVQEHIPSEQEPLEELLRKMSNSYNPKKKKSSEVKIPCTYWANKKRKGKKKVVDPVEAGNIEDMNLVIRDKEEAEEVEVVTPKAKKIKTSKKKSPSKTKSAKHSTLEKRTRSALKSRKVEEKEEEPS
ncbi:protein pxr1-like [Nicotiana sylvestris]|uniref:protein pxr1-like n=1 Tax=Nicotiana sylvestris TaxID=4096 RepID=UPI00388CA405